ncbi:recombinase family protein [Clostridioides difficile]|uniref:recombinase family protein n=3 Tax=Clostridia TaxID=186801 RepID=UPI000944A695|nr:recombinase family protein [Clostridioides difficile]HBR0068166.1 recombinase family protein [Klebsiella pneumoniae]EGT3688202.1 recombinase family protein [Clostridioides difficile]EKG0821263.1 recombinase family protein [Clostridioides difficile]MBF9949557.1 recombinase family protein [Clostridioides difficile]MBH7229433.1 recombinase family protein [Clostridioides difficile]
MEFIREDCIYARQSVDRKDSISIESQIDFCKYELKGGSCRIFKDKGYSGKNTDRPEFQKLLGEIRKGKVRRVIVYKLDRISRSILDFATMMELFQEYDVEFVSSTEKFDTSTPMGRAMLNICIVFAQLERETIQKRVTDAYYSRCLKGFHMSGQAPYGYQLEPTVVEGIRTKKMVADPVAADHVRLMFEMYAEPETSFGDITRYFEEHDIKIYGKSMFRTFLSQLLRNPVYAQADLELYEFFKSQGAAIVNDASDFAGTNGCYLYQGRDVKEDKDRCLKDQILVIAPHEALISSDTWLKCRKKLMANTTFQQGRKPKNTWLAGKIKCGHCGYALKATHVPNSTGYFRCTKRTENKGCPGCGKIRKEEFEQFIFSAMQEKFKDFQILHGREEKVNPKLTAYQVELAQVEAEIEKLLDTLTGANATLLAYANKKIEELDTRRQTISKAIAELSVETISPQQIKKLSYYLDNWDSIDFDDKRKAADGLISTIKATSDRVQIEWKI